MKLAANDTKEEIILNEPETNIKNMEPNNTVEYDEITETPDTSDTSDSYDDSENDELTELLTSDNENKPIDVLKYENNKMRDIITKLSLLYDAQQNKVMALIKLAKNLTNENAQLEQNLRKLEFIQKNHEENSFTQNYEIRVYGEVDDEYIKKLIEKINEGTIKCFEEYNAHIDNNNKLTA